MRHPEPMSRSQARAQRDLRGIHRHVAARSFGRADVRSKVKAERSASRAALAVR